MNTPKLIVLGVTGSIAAHKAGHGIAITGDLKRAGQRWVLEHPRNLLVIVDDDGSDVEI